MIDNDASLAAAPCFFLDMDTYGRQVVHSSAAFLGLPPRLL
jgi:hypothetical protein